MNLTLSKDDGHLLEERIRDHLRTKGIKSGAWIVSDGVRGTDTMVVSKMVRYTVDVFMYWLKEKSAPDVAAVDQLAQDYPNLTRTAETGLSYGHDATMEEIKRAVEELARLRLMGGRLNQLRRNITATQSATWSNVSYPLVAILNDAGYEDTRDLQVSEEQKKAHLLAYGGAGHFPELEVTP